MLMLFIKKLYEHDLLKDSKYLYHKLKNRYMPKII